MKIAIIQLNSQNDKKSNLLNVEQWVTRAYDDCQPALIALPEMFTFMGGDISQKKKAAESVDRGEAINLLRQLAQKFKVVIHGGSLCELSSNRYFNTTFIFDSDGNVITQYRKINLFTFNSEKALYDESRWLSRGNSIVTYQIGDVTVGCAICFDLRFGQLFQELIRKKVDLIIMPSAFTYETGKAHWEILCRARAIETQTYFIAPAQTGSYREQDQERHCYGHSMIVDPWGKIIAQMEEEVGFTYATLDLNFLKQVRDKLPCFTTDL